MLINSTSLKLQESKRFAVKKIETIAEFRPMSGKQTGGRFAPSAIRLRAIRRASHAPTRAAFADLVGLTVPNLSNLENGFPIGRVVQDKIVEKLPWVKRGFLMDGDQDQLTVAWLQRLLPLLAEESDTTLPPTRSRGKSGR